MGAVALAGLLAAQGSSVATAEPTLVAWAFARGDVRGVLLATMHAPIVEGHQGRKLAIEFRKALRRLVLGTDHVHFERPPLSEDGEANFVERTAPLPDEIASAVLSKLPRERWIALPDWAIAHAINQVRLGAVLMKSQLGSVESEIIKVASHKELRYSGLEPSSALASAFASMSSEAQRAMLEEALLDDAAVHTKLGKLTSHYLAGRHDAACLEVGVESQETDYWRAIVLRRNASWIKAVGALSPGSGHLVAVGLAHTCGQGSLIELMRDAGFSVSRVK